MRTLFYTVILFIPIVLSGCNTTFSGGYENTPEGNYDFFFYELENLYAYRDYTFENGLTLNQIKEQERVALLAKPSWDNLAMVLGRVTSVHLADPHTSWKYAPIPSSIENIFWKIVQESRSNEYDTYTPRLPHKGYPDSFLTTKGYFEYTTLLSSNQQHPIGYLHITDLQNSDFFNIEDENQKIASSLDSILKGFQSKGVDRMIIDIRSRAGGSAYIAEIIASRFINRTVKYAIYREKIYDNSYSQKDMYISPQGYSFFQDKPLVILVNTLTCSAGEILLLMLRQSGNSRVIGTPTLGCTGSALDRELPNGWIFQMAINFSFDEEGNDYFKVGIRPGIISVTQNYKDDEVLNLAIDTVRGLN